VKFYSEVSEIGPSTAKVDHSLAIRTKCDCKAGLRISAANSIQSAARRMHSNSRFRELTGSDTTRLLETQAHPCTASRCVSVVYATDKAKKSLVSTRPGVTFNPIHELCLGEDRHGLPRLKKSGRLLLAGIQRRATILTLLFRAQPLESAAVPISGSRARDHGHGA
jgi:hypothetical protein